MNKILPILMTSLALLMLTGSCTQRKESVYRKTLPLMDTIVSITVVSDSRDKAEKAMETAFAKIDSFGNLINFYSDGSELSAVNRNAGVTKTRVSPETLAVIERAVFAAEKSDGAFDPSIGAVVRLWDFHNRKKPADDELRRVLPLVNYRDIVINRDDATVYLRKKGMMLDLGGIAKGYAADLAVESLRNSGIMAGLVSIAGDIRTFGSKPGNGTWTIGIKNPRQTGENDEIIAKVGLSDKAISTSGDYERYFVEGGKRYHHLLDPRTGYPADGCRSVSIIADRGVDTDAYDNAVFVLGPVEGMKLVKEMAMDAIIIDSTGVMHMTDGVKEKISLEKGH
jgi:thiamine biosynthesis lipoprotein